MVRLSVCNFDATGGKLVSMGDRKKLEGASRFALSMQVGLFGLTVGMATVAEPFSDMFDLIARWLQYRHDGGPLAYVLDPHNFHRLAYTRALVLFDQGVMGGSGAVFAPVAALCLGVAAGLLAWRAWTWAPSGLRVPAAALAAMLVLTTVNALDVVFPIDTPYAHAFLFSVAAMALWDAERPWASLVLAVLAAFGNAVALALWPVLAVAAFRAQAWRSLCVIAGVGAGFVSLYALGQVRPPQPFDLLAAAHYGLVWLGLPWSTRLGGPLIGLVLAPLSIFLVLKRGGVDAPPLETLACRLILFSLGACAMAVLGRSGLEPDVPMRYALFLTPLHLGLFFLALPWLARRPAGATILLGLFALVLAQQAYGTFKVRAVANQIRAALADFHRGNDTPMVRVFVHPDPDRARRIEAELGALPGR
jgi:hypothetical protein